MVGFGLLYFCCLVGWHAFEFELLEDNVTLGRSPDADDLGNVSIQILTALFSYITLFTIPWRFANAIHLSCSHRDCDAGCDFYGRPTRGIWFHIPPKKRRIVVGARRRAPRALLCGNTLVD